MGTEETKGALEYKLYCLRKACHCGFPMLYCLVWLRASIRVSRPSLLCAVLYVCPMYFSLLNCLGIPIPSMQVA